MLKEFQHHLTHLIQDDPGNYRFLLAVSGGKDSIVLGDLFYCSGIPFGIAHMNFQLRGEESDGDERFVKAFAQRCEVECFTQAVETKSYTNRSRYYPTHEKSGSQQRRDRGQFRHWPECFGASGRDGKH